MVWKVVEVKQKGVNGSGGKAKGCEWYWRESKRVWMVVEVKQKGVNDRESKMVWMVVGIKRKCVNGYSHHAKEINKELKHVIRGWKQKKQSLASYEKGMER